MMSIQRITTPLIHSIIKIIIFRMNEIILLILSIAFSSTLAVVREERQSNKIFYFLNYF
jgi:hypothetical protein